MDIRFEEIDADAVKRSFPKFYGKRGQFFEIVHRGYPIGFVGVRPLDTENEGDCELSTGELSAFVFRQYRNSLTKGVVLAVLGLPQSLGFKRCWMKTARPTVIKLLNAMGKAEGRLPYGIAYVGTRQGKAVFVMDLRQTCLERKT